MRRDREVGEGEPTSCQLPGLKATDGPILVGSRKLVRKGSMQYQSDAFRLPRKNRSAKNVQKVACKSFKRSAPPGIWVGLLDREGRIGVRTRDKMQTPPSSSGPGFWILSPATGVQIPLGVLKRSSFAGSFFFCHLGT